MGSPPAADARFMRTRHSRIRSEIAAPHLHVRRPLPLQDKAADLPAQNHHKCKNILQLLDAGLCNTLIYVGQ
jgi:hypothetical protein